MTTGLSYLAVRLDERWLGRDPDDERLERAWPPSSRDAALVAFGPLAIPFHFMRTRGSFRSLAGVARIGLGLVLGIVVLGLVGVVSEVVLEGLAWALGLPPE